MQKLLTYTVAAILIACMTSGASGSGNGVGVAHASQAVVTNMAHPSAALFNQPRAVRLTATQTGHRIAFLPGSPAPLPVDNVLGGMLKQLGYDYR